MKLPKNSSARFVLRRVALGLVAMSLGLAACGGGSSSSAPSTRTKNAALVTNSSTTLFDASSTSGATALTPTSAPAAPSTAPAKPCSAGGPCMVGDTGPAGGIIILVNDDKNCGKACLYTEAAPEGWGEKININCDGTPRTTIAESPVVDPRCIWNQISKVAEAYRGGGFCNWRAPSLDHLKAMDPQLVTGLQQDSYWSTEFASRDRGGDLAWEVDFPSREYGDARIRNQAYVRAVHTFTATSFKDNSNCAPAPAASTTTTSTTTTTTIPKTTTTVKATTTTAKATTTTVKATTTTVKPTTTTVQVTTTVQSCATGGVCKVGDIGKGGGIVFYVAPQPFTLLGNVEGACNSSCRYLEAATNNWYRTGFDPIFTASGPGSVGPASGSFSPEIGAGLVDSDAAAAKTGAGFAAEIARSYKGGGKSDWFLPSRNELALMYKAQSIIKLNTPINGDVEYWSSTGYNDKSQFPTQFYKQNMTTGSAYEAQGGLRTRYVRPIRAF